MEQISTLTDNNDRANLLKKVIDDLMTMDGIVIEIIGSFIWVTGNTKAYKDKLKELKFQWHSKKLAWYLKPDDYKKRSQKDFDFETIRKMYGTSGTVKSKGTFKI